MAVDVSASMLAKDLKPNRLEALKKVAAEFIQKRPNDRIGLVEYAGESYTKTPVTSDKAIVLRALKEIKYNTIIQGGTAIGMGLANAVNRIKDSKAKSKIIILLTDGVNNAGFIDPKTASELAVEYGVKTYTIGLGTNGMALSPIAIRNGKFQYGRIQVEIDEALLKEIAAATGGEYFRATNNKTLKEIYDEIDKLEKTEIEEYKFYNYQEKYRPLVLLAGLLLLFEIILRYTLFKSFV
jgi:Ca-activated chloride channel family protein